MSRCLAVSLRRLRKTARRYGYRGLKIFAPLCSTSKIFSGRQPNLKNRVDELTEQAVLTHTIDYPAHGQLRVSNELRKAGVFVSPSGVRSIWFRHGLANFKDRLNALEGSQGG